MPRTFVHGEYRAPASALIDGFGGCTRCTVIGVIEPGEGNQFMRGRIRARVDETHGGYAKGEIVVMGPHDIVPRDRLYSRGFHYYINTQYAWVKEDRACERPTHDPRLSIVPLGGQIQGAFQQTLPRLSGLILSPPATV